MLELSVGRPYSIKSNFSFAVVHLLNQFNAHKTKNWKDDLPDDRYIDYKYLTENKDRFGAEQNSQNSFKFLLEILDQLNEKAFIVATQNFRNLLQHRFRLQFDMGLTPYFERRQTKTGVTYAYKIASPLQLETLIPALYEQHQKSIDAFKAYWKFLNEICTELGAKCQPINGN